MTSLTLREIGVTNDVAGDHDVLELFAVCREGVVHVAASHLLPDHVAVTTRNGFVELIDTATGEFRLFLTYLDRIPLDASLRCFSLVPSLYAASPQQRHRRHQHHLLYSLSYSNELLLANVETAEVRVFATCGSRPSVVQCDGDYIVCGEGNGQVAVWRASVEEWVTRHSASSAASASPLPPLWRTSFFDSTVVCANLHRDQLICCSADYRCVVACVEDGVVRATLPLDLDQAVAVFALTKPPATSLLHTSLAVCLTSRISVFTSIPLGDTATSAQFSRPLPTSTHSERWMHQGDCVVEREEVACASCLGGYLAAGTISGLVLLYSCDAAESLVRELVRFNVGYGVIGMQLFPSGTLLVVTSVGDVWRWPLGDLLRNTSASGTEGVGDELTEAEPTAATQQPPLPLAAPGVPAASSPVNNTLPTEPRAPATSYEVSYTQEGDIEDRSLSAHGTSILVHTQQREREATAEVEETIIAESVDADGLAVGASRDAEAEGTPSVHLSTASASVRTSSASPKDDAGEDHPDERGSDSTEMDPHRTEPATVSCLPPPPLPVSSTVSEKSKERRGVGSVVRCATESQRPTLYDPEQSTEGPEVVNVSVSCSAAGDSADLSHDDLHIAVSPPSTADTTTHHDAALEGSGAEGPEAAAKGPAPGAARVAAKEGAINDKRIQTFQSNNVYIQNTADVMQDAVHRSPGIASREGAGVKASVDDLELEFTHTLKRLLGPAVGVEGLRKNRRMSPRKVAGVLANLTNQQAAAAGAKALSHETPSHPRALEGLNSTKLLEEKRATLEAAAFNFEGYRQAHRLEVDALKYRHPLQVPTYTLQDRVFDTVESSKRLCDKESGTERGAAGNAAAVLSAAPQDDLRDVTYGKVKWTLDPRIAEERRRGGPEMAQHHCDDLIFSTPHSAKATVLFADEAPLMPSTAWEEVLLLPLPLPSAPSVF
ncbi:putative suppressive immunomodulating factor [Leishmania braziliensis MHOM/BR/75/M2904]|uniref:Suppressive immunomodulating factor n=2 Tax=Leishmania braziliensis TaxID=5660 RepID=A4H5F2_LEIBR|nr:putative suppressive immunomodulating factor [Leishmania braziliensis MHOM/BR/75/M2904]KAI5690092.1 hypothetical protein MNV84_00945 [Leishmania braziliensis]CAJ2467095.1 unnamed protein product [Leishmania braziliensis]CAJ2467834.1 unnamed protein product [Leishmania braziliensis]CAM37179.1 putative suppressive immunomodulating factor [Leishmania braziliensis MHOM/BR/75/M2904]SYZ63198.1 suppressive_immunomodulating_factor [Leishmania braziliensis MHOM/BR/75/M2904]